MSLIRFDANVSGGVMKRFFYLILSLLLITFLVGVFSVGAWFLLTSDSTDLTYDTTMATVSKAGIVQSFVDEHKTLLKTDYRLTYTQYLELSYTYDGKNYTVKGEYPLSREYYDTRPMVTAYTSPYVAGSTLTVKVLKMDPKTITIEQKKGAVEDLEWTDIAKIAVPVWAFFVIVTLVKYAKKSKKIRKQNFYRKMGMENYTED